MQNKFAIASSIAVVYCHWLDSLHRLNCSSKHLSYSRRRSSEQDYICDKYAARIYPCTGTQSILVANLCACSTSSATTFRQ